MRENFSWIGWRGVPSSSTSESPSTTGTAIAVVAVPKGTVVRLTYVSTECVVFHRLRLVHQNHALLYLDMVREAPSEDLVLVQSLLFLLSLRDFPSVQSCVAWLSFLHLKQVRFTPQLTLDQI